MKKLWFHFIMSIGPDCRAARHLQEHGLRTQASPLDWQMTNSLPPVLHLVRTSFQDFFEEIEDTQKQVDEHRFVLDTKNQIKSIHHFPISQDLLSAQIQFRQQMLHRWEKSDRAIKEGKRIALVSSRKEPLGELESFLTAFGEWYPDQKITMINIRDTDVEDSKIVRKEVVLSPRLKIIEYQFHDVHPKGTTKAVNPDFWLGNPEKWAYVMEQLRVINPVHFQKPCRYYLTQMNPNTCEPTAANQ